MPGEVSNLEGIRILVVDDDADSLELLVLTLEGYGAEVTAVTSAHEALQVLTQVKPNLLISDIAMPTEDGYTLIRQIRAMPSEQGGQIPAIAVTACVEDFHYQQAIAAGFQKYITKPIDIELLMQEVVSLVEYSTQSQNLPAT